MVKFKRYTQKDIEQFFLDNGIENVVGLSNLVEQEEAYLKFNDDTGVLTIKLQLKDEGDNSWN